MNRQSRPIAAVLLALGVLAACQDSLPVQRGAAGGDAAQGKQLLTQYQCGSCHRIGGIAGARGTTGPSLERFARASYIAGFIPNQPEALVRWITDPPALKPGTLMPAMGVSAGEARHMAAYLYTQR